MNSDDALVERARGFLPYDWPLNEVEHNHDNEAHNVPTCLACVTNVLGQAADRITTLTEQNALLRRSWMGDKCARHACVALRARVDLLEGPDGLLTKVHALCSAVIEEPHDYEYREQLAKEILAALDAATRSADTDGDEALRLHLASLDGAPGDAGTDLTDERSAE